MLQHFWYSLYIVSLTCGVATIMLGLYFKKTIPLAFIAILPVLGSVCTDLLGLVFIISGFKEQRVVLNNIYLPIDLWLNVIVAIYFIKNRRLNAAVITAAFLSTLLSIYYIYTNVEPFNNWGFVAVATLLVAVFIAGFVMLYNRSEQGLPSYLFFWVCISTLLFFSCNIPLFCSINYLMNLPAKQVYPGLWFMILLLNISRYLLLFIGLLVVNKRVYQQN